MSHEPIRQQPSGPTRARTVVRQSAGTSVVALVSVAAGLVLDLTIAALFGAGRQTDAFVLSARIPLGLVAIAMVIANQVLVPTLTTWLTATEEHRARRLTSGIMVWLVGGSVLLAAGVHLGAGALTTTMAPGFDPDQVRQAAAMLRIMTWYLPFVVLAEVFRSWLNAQHLFVIPAAMSLFLNVTAITVLLLGPRSIMLVPYAYLAGAAVQVLILGGYAAYRGMRPAMPLLGDGEVRATLALLGRPAAGAALNPVMRAVEIFFASFLPSGAATLVHFGNRLASAVAGTVVFRSIMVAVLPRQTRAWAAGQREVFDDLVRLGLAMMIYLAIPMGLIGAAVAWPFTRAVFTNGRFDAESASMLGFVMIVYALSFPASGLQRALLSAHYARRDTRSPWRNTIIGVLANVILLPILILPVRGSSWAIFAIPLAYGLAQYVHVWHARRLLRGPGQPDLQPLRRDLWLSLAASAAGGATGAIVSWRLHDVGSRLEMMGVASLALIAALGVWVVPLASSPRIRKLARQARRGKKGR